MPLRFDVKRRALDCALAAGAAPRPKLFPRVRAALAAGRWPLPRAAARDRARAPRHEGERDSAVPRLGLPQTAGGAMAFRALRLPCLVAALAASLSCVVASGVSAVMGDAQSIEAGQSGARKLEAFWDSSPKTPPSSPLGFVFFGIADWGGQEIAPYTTPGQLAVASAMGVVAAESGNHPAFVVAAGDNFYMDGLPGALSLRLCSREILANTVTRSGSLPRAERSTPPRPRRAVMHRYLKRCTFEGSLPIRQERL